MENDEVTETGAIMRYTASLRPTQNIDANWVKMGFNDRPALDGVVVYDGQEYKVTSVRKNR